MALRGWQLFVSRLPKGQSIVDTFSTLYMAVSRAMKARSEQGLVAYGVHAGQQFILQCLWREDGVTPGDLARRIGIEVPTVVRAVQRMEAAGLVRRQRDDRDARLVRVYLTERGEALRDVLPAVVHRLTEEALAGLSGEERHQLEHLLRRIGRNVGVDV